eukprot:4768683-Alexandrium_andersonii.AAC.1
MAGRLALRSLTGSAGIGWARALRPRCAGLCLRAPALRRRHCRAKREPDRGSLGRIRPIPPMRRPGEPT